jgi:hypothetical protein
MGRKLESPLTKPMYHTNPLSTPYSPARSHPPPWPNKNTNKYHNKYHYGTHSLAGTLAKQRPPPRPNIPTPIPILSIRNSRPPPWPIIHHCHCKQHSPISSTPPVHPPPWPIIYRCIHSTSQNHQNSKRRIKAKSRDISDEVSLWLLISYLLLLTIIIQISAHYHTLYMAYSQLHHHTLSVSHFHYSSCVPFSFLVLPVWGHTQKRT